MTLGRGLTRRGALRRHPRGALAIRQMPLLPVFEKAIAVLVNRVNEGAAVGQRAELAPNATQVHVDAAVIPREPSPERAQTQLVLAHGPPAMPQKPLQQAEFRAREAQGLSQPLDA